MTTESPAAAKAIRYREHMVTHEIIERVAEASDVDPCELPPLYNVVDTDALETLIDADPETEEVRVSFDYGGYRVSVTGSGAVSLTNYQELAIERGR